MRGREETLPSSEKDWLINRGVDLVLEPEEERRYQRLLGFLFRLQGLNGREAGADRVGGEVTTKMHS